MTRWGMTDLTGQLVKYAREGEDNEDWELIQLPAILPSGHTLWPAYWPHEEMLRTKATIPLARWSGQYMQSPVADAGALIKREWWKNWPSPDPPPCKFVVMAWDTAFSDKSDADRSAWVVWGEFEDADDPTSEEQPDDPSELRKVSGIILLDAYAARLNFPDLKQQALKFYVADMFSSGAVWAPMGRKWAQELIEEMAAFPHGEYDDLHDAAVLGLLRIRRGGFRIPTDAEEEPWTPRRPTEYY